MNTTGTTTEKTATQTAGTAPPTRRKAWMTYAILIAASVTVLAALGARRPATGHVIGFDSDQPPTVRMLPLPPAVVTPAVAVPAKRPQVEVVFALDTTSSMSGLIEGAKRKIWSIASFISKGQPSPDLRVGLVAYRDIGDAYVTRVFDLDGDLDRVYRHLRQFQAEGGGDSPEHVARGLHDAVNKMSWASVKDQDVLRLIYLVGDAPAHTDYDDGYDMIKATRAAAAKGIQVHAIRCGDDPSTADQWRKIAMVGKGQFLTIGQDGGMRDDHSPFDAELARLHDAVSDTVVAYGSKGREASASVKEAADAPLAVKAARAGFLAKRHAAVGGEGDLVEGVASGRVAMDKLNAAELPAELRAMKPAEQKAKISQLAEDRKNMQARIEDLSRKRDDYLASEERKAETARVGAMGGLRRGRASAAGMMAPGTPAAAPPAASSFDAEVAKTVVSGAKKIGVKY
jgi:hypothetical protein